MDLNLFAQFNPNAPGFQFGLIVGIVIAVILSAAIPIAFGVSRGRPALGVVGGVCAIPAAIVLGCLGGLPVALLFVGIIAVVSRGDQTRTKRRKNSRRGDDDDDDDEEYDRPRRSPREALDQYDDDRPRRSRRDADDDGDPRR